MSVTVVVGGQYGSEGKGKMVAHLALKANPSVAVVRCGGTNSGHTVDFCERPYPLRQLPSAAVIDDVQLYLGAGMIIDPNLLQRETKDLEVPMSRVHVDRNAVILDDHDRARESAASLRERVGSTLSGTGSATSRKVLRDPSQKTAKEVPALKAMVTDVSRQLNQLLDRGYSVIVEGTQGIGLSLHHSRYFPFATSRDTTAAAFLSEVGLAPTLVSDVIVVFRTFPIRVAGNSGPLPKEITWKEVGARARSPIPLSEYTTVTKRLRRVAEFDWDLAQEAVRINRPTRLALHGLDYVNFADRGVRSWDNLSDASKSFVVEVESRLGTPVHFVFTGPRTVDLVELSDALTVSHTQRSLADARV